MILLTRFLLTCVTGCAISLIAGAFAYAIGADLGEELSFAIGLVSGVRSWIIVREAVS